MNEQSPRKLHIIIGTKAQLIKMAPVLHELQKRGVDYNLVFTGQHHETIEELRANFNIKQPDHVLYGKDVTGIGQMCFWFLQTLCLCIKNKKTVFGRVDKSHIFVVHGDTFSALLGALVGKILRAKVAHVESGLRSFNIWHPFPEEITRLGTFSLSDIYFCPNEWAVDNLKSFKGKKINTLYNTLYDALRIATRSDETSMDTLAKKYNIPLNNYAVCTIHRFENIFNKARLEMIINYVREIAKDLPLLFVLHPPTVIQLNKFSLLALLESTENIHLMPRFDYLSFIKIVANSEFVISDGGSNQEETFYLGKPCILLRDKTERKEGIGKNVVISHYDRNIILDFTKSYKSLAGKYIEEDVSPSQNIVDTLLELTA